MLKWLTKKLNERKKEPSSWIGLGLAVSGIGELVKANGLPEIGGAIVQSAAQLAAGDYFTPLVMLVTGLAGFGMKEKGENDGAKK